MKVRRRRKRRRTTTQSFEVHCGEMERKEKGVEEREVGQQGKKQEYHEESKKGKEKLKPRKMMLHVGKRGGPSTPSPTWRLELSPSNDNNNSSSRGNPVQEFLNTTSTVSARKLCANLWEIHPHLHLPLSKMSKNAATARRISRGHLRHKKASDPTRPPLVDHPPSSPPHQPASASTLRRHLARSFMHGRQSIERNGHALQPVSSASRGSSMEMAPYNGAVTPSSSLEYKGRMGESNYTLRTSTELLKVLNRIWCLEEQQTSNMSLLKALKMELDHSRLQVKKMLKEKQTNRQEMENILKQVANEEVVRKNNQQDRMRVAIQSAREELEDERKLRKHSENLHRKLSRELSEIKSSFSNSLKELERERKARILLENLCDEFAKGIRDYEQEIRSLRHKLELDHVDREKLDPLVLHISEAWLDERIQMKLAEAQNGTREKNTIVDKLSLDIETFLEARHSTGLRKDGMLPTNETLRNCSRRESFPLKEGGSAPRAVADDDGTDSDSCCFELNKSESKKPSIGSSKGRSDNASESQLEDVLYLKTMKRAAKERNHFPEGKQSEVRVQESQSAIRNSATLNTHDNIQGQQERSKQVGGLGLRSNPALDHLIRNHSLSSEGDKIHPEGDFMEDSTLRPVFAGHASPVQRWMSKLTSPEFEKSEASLKLPGDLKENTLKAKLLEARLESQLKYRARSAKASF